MFNVNIVVFCFFVKQKTAYELRISDWSSDVCSSDLRNNVQIWEYLERRGLKVAAVSPMNAANRCSNPAFFLPDPWTPTEVTADRRVAKLFDLVRQVVNANASSDLSIAKLGPQLLPLALPYLSAGSIPKYLRIIRMATQYKWAKEAFLDRLLTA